MKSIHYVNLCFLSEFSFKSKKCEIYGVGVNYSSKYNNNNIQVEINLCRDHILLDSEANHR